MRQWYDCGRRRSSSVPGVGRSRVSARSRLRGRERCPPSTSQPAAAACSREERHIHHLAQPAVASSGSHAHELGGGPRLVSGTTSRRPGPTAARAKRAWPQATSKRHEQHSRPDTAAVRWQDIQLPWPKVPGCHVARPENHPPELDRGGTRPYLYDIDQLHLQHAAGYDRNGRPHQHPAAMRGCLETDFVTGRDPGPRRKRATSAVGGGWAGRFDADLSCPDHAVLCRWCRLVGSRELPGADDRESGLFDVRRTGGERVA